MLRLDGGDHPHGAISQANSPPMIQKISHDHSRMRL
jgi:hypothetical protein